MGKREPQTILKTDERSTVLELARKGKRAAKSSGWRAAESVRHYFPGRRVTALRCESPTCATARKSLISD